MFTKRYFFRVTGHGGDGSRWWRVTVVTGHGGDGSRWSQVTVVTGHRKW